MSEYDAADDGRRCYDLAVRCLREQMIRAGNITPEFGNETELRWVTEGPRPSSQLDTVREDAR